MEDFARGSVWVRWAVLMLVTSVLAVPALGAERAPQAWGVGWDDGLTVRRWLGSQWELSVAAGPDDYLTQSETRQYFLADPSLQHGTLQVPQDNRQEQGWVRVQVGHLITRRDDLALVGYTGLVYNWIDYQERSLVLDRLVGDFDTWELDRFTERWILSLGLRPSWRPADFLTIEMAVGLNFIWESWDQVTERTYAGVTGADRTVDSGHSRAFEDFGWEGAASLKFLFWF